MIQPVNDPRRSIESLRAGVPNRDAVRNLGTDQSKIEGRFRTSLANAPGEQEQGRQVSGFLILGGFGSGKSHLRE